MHNKTSISEEFPAGFNTFFPTVQETNHFMEVGCLKKKCILIDQFAGCDLYFVHHKRRTDF